MSGHHYANDGHDWCALETQVCSRCKVAFNVAREGCAHPLAEPLCASCAPACPECGPEIEAGAW